MRTCVHALSHAGLYLLLLHTITHPHDHTAAHHQNRVSILFDTPATPVDEMSRWLLDAASAVAQSARAGVSALARCARAERLSLASLLGQLESGVGVMAHEQQAFMQRHAIKVQTQVSGAAGDKHTIC